MFDYTKFCAQFDLSTPTGVANFLAASLGAWRDEKVDDLAFDDLIARAVSALNTGA